MGRFWRRDWWTRRCSSTRETKLGEGAVPFAREFGSPLLLEQNAERADADARLGRTRE